MSCCLGHIFYKKVVKLFVKRSAALFQRLLQSLKITSDRSVGKTWSGAYGYYKAGSLSGHSALVRQKFADFREIIKNHFSISPVSKKQRSSSHFLTFHLFQDVGIWFHRWNFQTPVTGGLPCWAEAPVAHWWCGSKQPSARWFISKSCLKGVFSKHWFLMVSLSWFMVFFTGHHGFCHHTWLFPVNFPIIQHLET